MQSSRVTGASADGPALYSDSNAVFGCNPAARNAGTQLATTATASTTTLTNANTAGSCGDCRNKNGPIQRPADNADRWIDYLHIATWNGRWVIINVLWENRP